MTDKQPEALTDPQLQMWAEYCAMKEEVERLHEVNAELVEAVKAALSDDQPYIEKCKLALAKAQGENND